MTSHTCNPGSQDAAGESKFEASKSFCSEILSQNETNKKDQRNKNAKSQTK